MEVDRSLDPGVKLASIHRAQGIPNGIYPTAARVVPSTLEMDRADVPGVGSVARKCSPVGDS